MITNQVQENIHLDYKDSRAIANAKRDSLAKDASSFANSDGGVLIYGVVEKDQLPTALDDGVEDSRYPREWIEDAIITGITPRLDLVRVYPLPVGPGRTAYVIEIAKSFRGPHQASDKRYYKRHNFKSVPMEDYEISDVRARRKRHPSLVSFELSEVRQFLSVFDISNVGDIAAEDVTFEFSEDLPWPEQEGMPRPLSQGIRSLAPRQRLRFRYFTFPQILGPESIVPSMFSVRVSYFHSYLGSRLTEEYFIDFEALRGSMSLRTDLESDVKEAVEAVKKLSDKVEKIGAKLEPLADICGATGLRVSAPTLRNLRRVLLDRSEPEPIDPAGEGPRFFQEVLGVDHQLAMCLYGIFYRASRAADVKGVPGMSDEIMDKVRSRLILDLSEDEELLKSDGLSDT